MDGSTLKIARAWKRPALWLFVLAGSELLMQWHGWHYWMAAFDRRIGWAIPIVLSILAAALWWNFSKAATTPRAIGWGIVACCASVVLLSGPVLQVGVPVIEKWQNSKSRPERIRGLEKDLAASRSDVKRYQDLREAGVIGYFELLQQANAKANEYERKLQLLRDQPVTLDWLAWVGVGLLIAALVFLQAGAALAAIWLARDWPPPSAPVKPVPPPVPAAVAQLPRKAPGDSTNALLDVDDMQVKRLQHAIKALADKEGKSPSAWGEHQEPKIHKRDISNLFHYFTQKSQGKRPEISRVKLAELASRYLRAEVASGS